MTVSVHVDPCPTCQGEGYASNEMVMGVECPDCSVMPGFQVPEWVAVPTVAVPTYRGPAAGNIVITETEPEPDPRYVPGASVTLTADCSDCHGEVVMHAPNSAVRCPQCDNGKVVVGSAVIADLVPVGTVADHDGHTGDDDEWPAFVEVNADGEAFYWPEGVNDAKQIGCIDVDCAPGDVLARLDDDR